MHMYLKHKYGMKTKKWLMWQQMHMLKIKCITMDQYGKSIWIPFCFLAWIFWVHSRKQCWSLDLEQKYPNSLQILIYFVLFNPNQEYYIIIYAKCLMFLWFPNKHGFPFWKFLKHHINLLPCLVFTEHAIKLYFLFHCFLLVFQELILGYVIFLDWYPKFLMVRLYPKRSLVLTLHSSNHDLNLETLEGKCIKKWYIFYHRNMLIKTYRNMDIKNF